MRFFLRMANKHPVINKQLDDLILGKNEEELLRIFLKRIPTAIAVLDNNLQFIIASDSFIRISGLPFDIVEKQAYWYDIVPDMPKKWRLIHQRTLTGEHLKCDEDVFYRDDGSLEWWRWESLPWYKAPNEIGGILINIENITQHKKTEKNLKQLIKSLNESNRALARFAHICAHDLNEPLRTITNYVQLIEKFCKNDLNEALKSYLRTIVDNARCMNTLVRSLLDYSQIRIRKIKPESINLNHVINLVLNEFHDQIIELHAQITFDTLPQVHVDKSLIIQVIQNLLSNALKFNDKKIPIIHLAVKDCNHFWLFSINDNGIGIEDKYLNKIFVEFMRLHPKDLYNGSGIGLSQCKKIIEDHNGRIWARSIPKEGTTFFFTLPKAENP